VVFGIARGIEIRATMAGSSVRNGNGGGMDDGLPAVSAGTSLSTR
jgi:hypothetical protein